VNQNTADASFLDIGRSTGLLTHPLYGAALPARGWVPAPRYLLRRDRIHSLLDGQERGRLLEVGCGAGALLFDLAESGFACDALETSADAFELATELHRDSPLVAIYRREDAAWAEAFDYVLAFEVLEHIEDDSAALARWRSWLKPDGCLMLSVPAHPSMWNASDVWAGHYRRYHRSGLTSLLERAGFTVEKFECYGFPLANVTEPIRAALRGRELKRKRRDHRHKATATGKSGILRDVETALYPIYSGWLGQSIMRLCFFIQNAFLRTEFGTGYLVLARRRES
jgi:SAM-dependent methyltransferase